MSDESNKSNPENVTNCRNYDIEDNSKVNNVNPNYLSSLHLNKCSLNKTFEVEYLFKVNQAFHITTITESRIKTDVNLSKNIHLPKFCLEHTRQLNLVLVEH